MEIIKHPVAVRIIKELLEYIPTTASGTYNTSDPTHFEKGKLIIPFEDNNYKVYFRDCTWGIDVEIAKQFGPFVHQTFKEVGDIYIDGNELIPRKNWVKGNLTLCAKLLKHLKDTRAVNYHQLKMEEYLADEGDHDLGCPLGYM